MNNFKKALSLVMAAGMIFSLAACSTSNTSNKQTIPEPVNDENSKRIITALREKYKYSEDKVLEIKNLATGVTKPEGSIDVVISTTKGDVELRLFPDKAPLAVENFVTKAKNGEYDGTIFHRVMNNFMIQGGDPEGTGRGGKSIWGDYFKDEFAFPTYNYRGAISMANSGENTNGSQFFIVQAKTDSLNGTFFPTNLKPDTELNFEMVENWALSMNFYEEYVKRQAVIDKAIEDKKSEEELGAIAETLTQEMIAIQEAPITDEIIQKYMPVVEYYYTVGGTPHLDNIHTVFGYVINGIDVVDKIAAVEVIDTIDNKPKEDVVINSITVKE